MKKRIAIVACCIALLISLSFGATYAYLITRDEAVNIFTVGETVIEIEEEFDPPPELKPGVEFTKKPHVKNTGNLPCFVRMRADFSISDAEDFCEPLIINNKWVYNATDGYYYYKDLVQPGESTTDLFTKVKIRDDVLQTELKEFDLLIYAEAKQHSDHDNNCPNDEFQTVWQ